MVTTADLEEIAMEPFSRNTILTLGSLVEIKFDGGGSNKDSASDVLVGYVIKVDGGKVHLTQQIPEKRFRVSEINRKVISECRTLSLADAAGLEYHEILGFQPPDNFKIGALVELVERHNGSDYCPIRPRIVGYVYKISTDGVKVS